MRRRMESVVLTIVLLLAVSTSFAQTGTVSTVNELGTCQKWNLEIHQIITEKDSTGIMSVDVTCNSGQKTITIFWNGKKIVIDNISFDLVSKEFTTAEGKSFQTNYDYFDALWEVRGHIYKIYQKGIFSPDFQKNYQKKLTK